MDYYQLGKFIKKRIRTKTAFDLLDSDKELSGCDWGAGACCPLAQAIQQVFGGELKVIKDDKGRVQHVLVAMGDGYIDDMGFEDAAHKLDKSRLTTGPFDDREFYIDDFEESESVGRGGPGFVEKVKQLLLRKFEDGGGLNSLVEKKKGKLPGKITRLPAKKKNEYLAWHGGDVVGDWKLSAGDFGINFGTKEQAEARLTTKDGGDVKPYIITLKKPLVLFIDFGWWPDSPYWKEFGYVSEDYDGAIIDNLIAQGYDGIIYPNSVEGEGESYIVFNPKAIRPAEKKVEGGSLDEEDTSYKTLLSLFDFSGTWAEPFRLAGWNVVQWDIKLSEFMDINLIESAEFALEEFGDVSGIIAAPPCTDFTTSGSQWWAFKDEAGVTWKSIQLVNQVMKLVDLYEPTDPEYDGVWFWAIENPVGRMGRLVGLPMEPWYFQPNEYAGYLDLSKKDLQRLDLLRKKEGVGLTMEDAMFVQRTNAYTKKTGLWGEFRIPTAQKPIEPVYALKGGQRTAPIDALTGGKSARTKELRSNTPLGFARAFFEANKNYRAHLQPIVEVKTKRGNPKNSSKVTYFGKNDEGEPYRWERVSLYDEYCTNPDEITIYDSEKALIVIEYAELESGDTGNKSGRWFYNTRILKDDENRTINSKYRVYASRRNFPDFMEMINDATETIRQFLNEKQFPKEAVDALNEFTGIKEEMKTGGKFTPVITTPAELRLRWNKKKNSIKVIAGAMQRLKNNLTRDLKSENEKTRLVALVIWTMIKTYERIGNATSAKEEGHYGVTFFKKRHLHVSGSEVSLKYVAKSGVQQNKQFSDSNLAEELTEAKDNSPDSYIFTTTEGRKITPAMVDGYLKPFGGIKPKDIRGYSANELILKKLKTFANHKDQKERETQFREAVKYAAERVGHGSATLKKHYLIPELEEKYLKHGQLLNLAEFTKKYESGGELVTNYQLPERYLSEGGGVKTDRSGNYIGDTRSALKKEYGETIILYRAEGRQRKKPTQNWASTKEGAMQYGNNVIKKEIPIDNVFALNTGLTGKYEEFIVGKSPIRYKTGGPIKNADLHLNNVVEIKGVTSSSAVEVFNDKLYVVGDDATKLMITDKQFRHPKYIQLFEGGDERVAKALKADLEASALIDLPNKQPAILFIGSASRETRKLFVTVPIANPEKFKILPGADFWKRVEKKLGVVDSHQLNIEAAATIDSETFILSNRNLPDAKNNLIITSPDFYRNQVNCPIRIAEIVTPPKRGMFLGVSGMCHITGRLNRDVLMITCSVEDSSITIDDGSIGNSYLGWINNISQKLGQTKIEVDGLINLSKYDARFKGQKIEGVAWLEGMKHHSNSLSLVLVSDNDTGASMLFDVDIVLPVVQPVKHAEGGKMTMNAAPNGKPSNLSPMQYELVRTPAFKAWFGDWENDPAHASKVVDENGEPMVIYHGTTKNFTVFRPSKYGSQGKGIYFAKRKEYAHKGYNEPSKIIPVFAKIISNKDGIINEGYEVIVYNPKNVKVADGTNTSFDGRYAEFNWQDGGGLGVPATIKFFGIDFVNTFGVPDAAFKEAIFSFLHSVSLLHSDNVTGKDGLEKLQAAFGEKYGPMMDYIKAQFKTKHIYQDGGGFNHREEGEKLAKSLKFTDAFERFELDIAMAALDEFFIRDEGIDAGISFNYDTAPDLMYIARIDAYDEGKGAGTKFLKKLKLFAFQNGYKGLFAYPENERSKHFFVKNGFEEGDGSKDEDGFVFYRAE